VSQSDGVPRLTERSQTRRGEDADSDRVEVKSFFEGYEGANGVEAGSILVNPFPIIRKS